MVSNSDNDEQHPEGLTRTGVHRVLAHELGERWRFFRWVARQFTPTSLGVLGVVLTGAGGWIERLSTKVNVQGEHILVLETKVVPDLELTSHINTRISQLEVDVATLKGAVGQFDWESAQKELSRDASHGRPYSSPNQMGNQDGKKRRGTN